MGKRGSGFVSFAAVTAAAVFTMAAVAAGCTTKSSGGSSGNPNFDSGEPAFDATSDSVEPQDSPAQDSPIAVDSPADSPATADSPSGDGGLPDGYVGYVADIPVADQVTALAVNPTTDRVYAAMIDLNGKSGGIAVIDDVTGAVTTTIAPAMTDAGPVAAYFYDQTFVVDPVNNLLYAVEQFSTIVDVFDLAANTFKATFDVKSLDPNCQGFGVNWLAVDGAHSRVYASCSGPLTAGNVVNLTTISTGGGYALVASLALNDLQSTQGVLALDTTNQLLFVSNSNPNAGEPPPAVLVDTINTATNQEVAGMQQNLGPGNAIGAIGIPGYAVLATNAFPDAGMASTFFSLEPGSVPLPAGFVGDYPASLPVNGAFMVWGHEAADPSKVHLELVTVDPTEAMAPKLAADTPATTPLTTGDSVDPTGLVCGTKHCFMNGYEYIGAGSNPFAWMLVLY
jgi:hypothetical protein